MKSRRLSRTRLAAALLAALCLPGLPLAQNATPQQQPAPTPTQQSPAPPAGDEEVIRISTELVQTDVMVFDKSGKFVDGLTPEQFELRVDGKPQRVAFFERIRAGAVNEDAQIAAARGRGGAANASPGEGAVPLDRGRTVVFFVDDLHLSPPSVVQIRKTLLRFIDEELGQNDEAVVVAASGQVGFLQQLTDDKAVLRAAAGRLNVRPYAVRDGQSPSMRETHAVSIERNDTPVIDYFVEQTMRENPLMSRDIAEQTVRGRARAIVQQSRAIANNTLYSLQYAVRGFAPLPGRKVLFFISDGFIVDDGDSSLRDRLQRITDAAARAGVVIYSLDAAGLRTSPQFDASERGSFDAAGRLNRAEMGEISEMQAPLHQLASETGGRALINTNALDRVVTGALKETSLYYLLAWRPDEQTQRQDGRASRFQRIEVSVAGRPDLRVMVRRGFFSAPPPDPEPRPERKRKEEQKQDAAAAKVSASERDLVEALRAPLPRAALPTSLAVGYVNGREDGGVLTVSVELARDRLTFEQGEKPRAEVEVRGAVVNDQGKTVTLFGQRLSVTANPSSPPSEQHVIYSFSLPVAAGLYQVRAAARDERSGRTGSAMQWVEVPEMKKQFSMSSLYLGERAATQQPEPKRVEDLPRSVLLNVDRRFARTSHMRFLTYVYNAAGTAAAPPDVALQIQLFRDDQPVFTAPLTKLKTDPSADASQLPYMAELSLNGFQPGRYVLQITAIDRAAKATVSRRARFVIE